MSDSGMGESARAALAHLDAALAELAGLPLDSLSGIEVVGLWREVEARRRRLAPVDQALIAQV